MATVYLGNGSLALWVSAAHWQQSILKCLIVKKAVNTGGSNAGGEYHHQNQSGALLAMSIHKEMHDGTLISYFLLTSTRPAQNHARRNSGMAGGRDHEALLITEGLLETDASWGMKSWFCSKIQLLRGCDALIYVLYP